MSLNWSWKYKMGEIVVEQSHSIPNGTGVESTKDVMKFKVNLYHANCLCAGIYEYKDPESDKTLYQVYSFFLDVNHMKRCLGLTNNTYNLFDGKNGCDKWVKIKLNTYYKECMTMAPILTKAGFKVELYYKVPRCELSR